MAMRAALPRLPRCDVVQLTGSLSLPERRQPDRARARRRAPLGRRGVLLLRADGPARRRRPRGSCARSPRSRGRSPPTPRVTKAVVGIGAWAPGLSTVADAVDERDRRMLHDLGVCGELSGVQFDAEGRAVITPLTERLIGIDADALHAVPEVVAIAYDAAKARAVAAAIRGGFVTSLVTPPGDGARLLP